MSASAQLREERRRADIAHANRIAAGAWCTYCGELYAPAGPLAIAVVLAHLSRCPELAWRRTLGRQVFDGAAVSESEARALDGNR